MQHERLIAQTRSLRGAEEVLQARLHPRRAIGFVVHGQAAAARQRDVLRHESFQACELGRRHERAQVRRNALRA